METKEIKTGEEETSYYTFRRNQKENEYNSERSLESKKVKYLSLTWPGDGP